MKCICQAIDAGMYRCINGDILKAVLLLLYMYLSECCFVQAYFDTVFLVLVVLKFYAMPSFIIYLFV